MTPLSAAPLAYCSLQPIAHAQTLVLAPWKPVCITSVFSMCFLKRLVQFLSVPSVFPRSTWVRILSLNAHENCSHVGQHNCPHCCLWGAPCLSSSLVVYDSPEFSFLGPPCATPVPYRHSCSRAASSLTSISFSVLGLHRARYLTGSLCVFSLLSTLAHLL